MKPFLLDGVVFVRFRECCGQTWRIGRDAGWWRCGGWNGCREKGAGEADEEENETERREGLWGGGSWHFPWLYGWLIVLIGCVVGWHLD